MKKTVNSYNLEFGYELLSAIPYAYELFLEGKLAETISGYDTEPLYYFSPKHKIDKNVRGWHNINKARRAGLPYTYIHNYEQPDKKFPPYKEVYANKEYKWDKPTLVIGNRKNVEWGVEAINYFDLEILEWLFTNLKDKYEIIYFSIDLPKELQDNVDPEPIGDADLAKKHGIKVFREMVGEGSWNETILKVFSNCEHYITMNGGYSILASLFSGTNIIYSKPGQTCTREIEYNSFWRWYPNINGVRTLHVPDYEELKQKVTSIYIDKDPCINVLIRSSRPNYLKVCMRSVEAQKYPNKNVVISCDSDKAVVGSRQHKARMMRFERHKEPIDRIDDPNYGKPFPANKYLDVMQRAVDGYIVILDDDDKFTRDDALDIIAKNLEKDKLLVWKVDFNENGVKPSFSFGKEIKLYDLPGIGIGYHTQYVDHTDWTEWKRADYRTAKKLSEAITVKWLDEVLTGLQDQPHAGSLKDLPDSGVKSEYLLTYPNGKSFRQFFSDKELKMHSDSYNRQGICIEQVR